VDLIKNEFPTDVGCKSREIE